jgi:hypothetical protein
MENFGQLHVCSFDGDHVMNLRAVCKSTPCDAQHDDFEGLLPQHVRALVHQTCPDAKVILRKVPDGYLLITDRNQVICAIKDEHICQPVETNASSHGGGRVIIHSIVTQPGQGNDHFMFSENCQHVVSPNIISNYHPIDHIIAKFASAIALTNQPRIIYHAPNLGALHGLNILGPDAYFMKKTFLKLVTMTGGKQMYDVPIKITERLARLLTLNDPEGNICCAPLADGIMGYRNRRNNAGKTLIFICNCDDFFHGQLKPPAESSLQLFKMNYFDKSSKGPRIFVDTSGCHDTSPPPPGPTISIHHNNNNINNNNNNNNNNMMASLQFQQQQLQIQQQQLQIQQLQGQLQRSSCGYPMVGAPPQIMNPAPQYRFPTTTTTTLAVHPPTILQPNHPSSYGAPAITPSMKVQQALNVIEFIHGKALMDHIGCANYPAYCESMRQSRL